MSSKELPVEQARKVLGDLVIAAMRGETTTLTRYGKPVAQVTPYPEDYSGPAVTLFKTESDNVVIAQGGSAWDLGPVSPDMENRFFDDARAWLNGDWEPNERDDSAPADAWNLTAVAELTAMGPKLFEEPQGAALVYIGEQAVKMIDLCRPGRPVWPGPHLPSWARK